VQFCAVLCNFFKFFFILNKKIKKQEEVQSKLLQECFECDGYEFTGFPSKAITDQQEQRL
jgi:hypothetical protein